MDDDEIMLAWVCCHAEAVRLQRGMPADVPPSRLAELRALETKFAAEANRRASFLRTRSVDGHAAGAADRVVLNSKSEISSAEAAKIVGQSARHVRRHPEDFGGRQLGRVWIFDEPTCRRWAATHGDQHAEHDPRGRAVDSAPRRAADL